LQKENINIKDSKIKEEQKQEKIEEIKENKLEKTYKKTEDNFQIKNVDFKVLGQIFNSFILVERDGILEIYDQHIVHERILYEKLKKEYYNTKVSSQQLLVPIRILVDPREKELVFENIESFSKFGFEIDEFGDNEILIRSVPIMNFRDSVENIFREILKNLRENKTKDIREEIIISMSCRGAVKANEKLTQDEMEIMVKKLHQIGEYTCPHGRPIIIKITLDDLEKLFKRK
ncbi:MAG: DNA mismatch repair protein MutL, partial [Fusobacterium sp.]|nr:DNA mismatch repair protein MutL [Fusobacterium sp.]